MDTPPPSTQSGRRGRGPSIVVLFVMILVPVSAAMALVWYFTVKSPDDKAQSAIQQTLLQTIGLDNPATNTLAPQFVDADQNMVADAPTDPKMFVDPPVLYFSYVAVEDPSNYKKTFTDFLAYLSKVTGKPVEYLPVTTSDDQLHALKEGKLQVCGFNTGNVPVAVDLCGFVPVCGLGNAEGRAVYQMEIIAAAGGPITSIEGMRGHELTLTDPGSFSGYRAPIVLLKDSGMLPGRDYILRYSSGHEASIEGVASKLYEAAAVANDVLARQATTGAVDKSKFTTVYKSESFPSAAFGYAYNLKPELAAAIRKALFDFKWKGSGLEKEFGSSSQDRFVPVNFKDDWALVRRIDSAVGYRYALRGPSEPEAKPTTTTAPAVSMR